MLPHHREAFFSVAQEHWCWIFLREPNPLSDNWIGKFGFTPKPKECAAKTSDNPEFKYSGLVVDPTIFPNAFRNPQAALNKWHSEFSEWGRLPPGFTCENQGLEKGLVKLHGKKIHADYDLMALTLAHPDGQIKSTGDEDIESVLFPKVQASLNNRFGTPMVQHGSEFDPTFNGLGAKPKETILIFGPNRQSSMSMSSMPKKGH